MLDKYVLFCENNGTMMVLEEKGDRMAATELIAAPPPTYFTYKDAMDYLHSQSHDGKNALLELYRPIHVDEIHYHLGRDKAGWQSVDTTGLNRWADEHGITNKKLLRCHFSHIAILLLAGREKEASEILQTIH